MQNRLGLARHSWPVSASHRSQRRVDASRVGLGDAHAAELGSQLARAYVSGQIIAVDGGAVAEAFRPAGSGDGTTGVSFVTKD